MAFHKVSDEEGHKVTPATFHVLVSDNFGFTRTPSTKQSSGVTTGHTTWRCGSCRALAVGALGCSPPSACGKCGNK